MAVKGMRSDSDSTGAAVEGACVKAASCCACGGSGFFLGRPRWPIQLQQLREDEKRQNLFIN